MVSCILFFLHFVFLKTTTTAASCQLGLPRVRRLEANDPTRRQPYRDVVGLSDGSAEGAAHDAADVAHGHAAAEAVFVGRVALHAGKTPQGTAACREETRSVRGPHHVWEKGRLNHHEHFVGRVITEDVS